MWIKVRRIIWIMTIVIKMIITNTITITITTMIGIIAIVKIKNKFKIKMRVKRVNSIIRQKIKIIIQIGGKY